MGWPRARARRMATRATTENGAMVGRLARAAQLAAVVRAAPVQPLRGGGCSSRPLAGDCARLRLGWLWGPRRQACRMGWLRARARRAAKRATAEAGTTMGRLELVEQLAALVCAALVLPPHGGGCPPRSLADDCARLF